MRSLRPRFYLCVCLFIALAAAGSGCRQEPEPAPEPPAPVRPLLLELQATIIGHGWNSLSDTIITFDGSTMLVIDGGQGLLLYGLADPGHPILLASVDRFTLGGYARAAVASNGRAFVAIMGNGEIVELDISTLSSPLVVNRFSTIPGVGKLELRGNHLFVHFISGGNVPGGVFVYDISHSPAQLVGQYLVSIIDPGFCVSDSKRIFLAHPEHVNWTSQIDVADMADPANPVFVYTWPSSRAINIEDMCTQNGRLYCAAYLGGILVLKGADEPRLDLEAEFDWSDIHFGAWSIAAVPPYVFVARGDSSGAAESFQAFRQWGSSLTLVWEQAAQFPIHSVTVSGNLLVTVEQESLSRPNPQKILKLLRIFAEN